LESGEESSATGGSDVDSRSSNGDNAKRLIGTKMPMAKKAVKDRAKDKDDATMPKFSTSLN
jgi:hypothetical protein